MTIDPNSTLFYAPQARLVDLENGRVVGATKTANDAADAIAPDIVSAKVTLTNTGICQLNVTLNNQRFLSGQSQPPPWKYNDFSIARHEQGVTTDGLGSIVFGKLLRLDLRYGASRWVKMIVVQVNDLQFSFPAGGGAQVQVIGEDLLCRTKTKPDADIPHRNEQEEDIVRSTWEAAFSEAPARPTFQSRNKASDEGRTQPMRNLAHEKTKTYFSYMQEIAERLDYEMHLKFKEEMVDAQAAGSIQASSGAIQVSNELDFWFEPARSKTAPEGELQDGLDPGTGADAPRSVTYELMWGRNLLELAPKFKVFDMPTRAEANGTILGQRRREESSLTDAEIETLLEAELPASPSYDGDPVNALEARSVYFRNLGQGGNTGESGPSTNLDRPRLKLKAAAQFMKKAREFMTADGQVIGLPRLRPGSYVHIMGLRPPFDGYYYVTKTVHTLDSSGYRTQFSVRRPGMLPPSDYLPTDPPDGDAPEATA